MRLKLVVAWLPLFSILTCSVLMALVSLSGQCWGISWLCHERGFTRDVATMMVAVSLPVLAVIGWGLCLAVRQFVRARRARRSLLRFPRHSLAPSLRMIARELGVEDRLDVVACPDVEACCYGYFRPRIHVTTGLLSILSLAEFEAVLRHEQHHLRRRDPLRALLWTMLGRVCWWEVDSLQHPRLRQELAADRAVITAGGRQALASALFKLLTHSRRETRLWRMVGDVAISRLSITDARIDQLLQLEHMPQSTVIRYRGLVLSALTVATMLLCALLMGPA